MPYYQVAGLVLIAFGLGYAVRAAISRTRRRVKVRRGYR